VILIHDLLGVITGRVSGNDLIAVQESSEH
jgi:hypothetical protein